MLVVAAAIAALSLNTRPIVGVLTLPLDHSECLSARTMLQHSGTHATSCLSTLYVKWLESAGARVAPIRYDLPAIELRALLSSLNGALITGGEIDITSLASPYMQAAGTLYGYALERHAASEVWPLWGTCMGLQVLSILGAGSSDVLARRAYHTNLLLPLSLTPAAQHSRMLCSPTNAPACEAPVAAAAVRGGREPREVRTKRCARTQPGRGGGRVDLPFVALCLLVSLLSIVSSVSLARVVCYMYENE